MSHRAWWSTALVYLGCWMGVGYGAVLQGRPSTMALGVALAFVPYAWFLHRFPVAESGPSGGLPPLLGRWARRPARLACALGVVLLTLPPLLSDDLYRYVWDGRVLAAGLDPYAHAPEAAALAPLRDACFWLINHAELPTIYPPVAVLAFACVAWLGPLGPKLLALLGLVLLVRAAPTLVPPAQRERVAFAVATNPLLLAEGPLHGHVDVLAAGCVVIALSSLGELAERPRGAPQRRHLLELDRRRALRVWLFASLATGLKLVGLLLVPVILASRARNVRLALAVAATGALLLVPVAHAGHADRDGHSGLSHYARRWQGNDGLYGALETAIAGRLVEHYGLRWGKLDLDPPPSALVVLERLGVDVREGLVGPKKEPPPRELLEPRVLARPLARATVALLGLILALSSLTFRAPPALALRRLVLAALLLAPQLHPWYLALLVPLEFVTMRAAGLGFAAAAYVAYAPHDAWLEGRVWHVDPAAPAALHVYVWALIVVELVQHVRVRRRPRLHER